jgi:hypothetical protein
MSSPAALLSGRDILWKSRILYNCHYSSATTWIHNQCSHSSCTPQSMDSEDNLCVILLVPICSILKLPILEIFQYPMQFFHLNHYVNEGAKECECEENCSKNPIQDNEAVHNKVSSVLPLVKTWL